MGIQKMMILKTKNGFTLLEVVIAIFIAAICLTAALLGLNIVRQRLQQTITLTKAKGIVQTEIEMVRMRTFSELDGLQSITINGVIKNGVFHAFTDNRDIGRREYFAVYKVVPGLTTRFTLKDKSRYFLTDDKIPRLKVWRKPAGGLEVLLTKTQAVPGLGEWTLETSSGDYKVITIGAGTLLPPPAGDQVWVEYVPAFVTEGGMVDEYFAAPDATHKKSTIVLTKEADDVAPVVILGGYVRNELTTFFHDSPNSQVVLSTTVNDQVCVYPNPIEVKGGYTFPPGTIIDPSGYTLQGDLKTIFFTPKIPETPYDEPTESLTITDTGPTVTFGVTGPDYKANCTQVPNNPLEVRKNGGLLIFGTDYRLEADQKTISIDPAKFYPGDVVTVKYAYDKDYYIDVKYVHLESIPSSVYDVGDPNDKTIKFNPSQPDLATSPPATDWPYYFKVTYLPPVDEPADPPLTDQTVITQVEDITTGLLKRVSVSIYQKDQLNRAPIVQEFFYFKNSRK